MTERRLIKSSSQAVARQWPELVSGGKPNGMPIEVLTGFVRDNGDAMGRPVGVALDQRAALSLPMMSATPSGASAERRR